MSRSAWCFAAGVLLAASLSAQNHPNLERGFDPEKLYQMGDLDAVALANGTLAIEIPLPRYAESSRLSYGPGLFYSSQVWDLWRTGSGSGAYLSAIPDRASNAGLGFRVSLGELLHPDDPRNETLRYQYVSPDGGVHELWPTLHGSDPQDPGDGGGTDSTLYTRDSSYLRLRLNVAAGGHEIDFGDGTTHRFAFNTETPETYDTRLVEIHDSFKTGSIWNNRVTIGYTSDEQGPIWEISDSHGRVQRVYFRYLGYDETVKPMVDRLELTAFGGQTATYQFRYFGDPGEPAAFQLRRDCRDGAGSTPGLLDVALLSSVVQPDGSKWAMDYWNDVTGCPAGQLESLTLPTGGRIDYAYNAIYLPTADECDELNRIGAKSIVLATRTFVDPVSPSPDGTWSYEYVPSPIPIGSPDTCLPSGDEPGRPSEELLVVVQTPLHDKTEHFFSTWPLLSDSPMGFRRIDYGLPITRELEPGDGRAPVDGRYLSSRSYDCDASGLDCVLKRSEYLTYDDDANSGSALDLELVLQRNRRVKARRTIYHDDAGRYRDVVFSDFNGLGRHRVATWSGTFDAGNDPIERIGYLPSGSYPGSFTPILPTSPWILGTYASTEVTEGGDTSRRELTFDAATGFLDCERWLKTGTVRSPQDVLVRYSHVEGDVTLERFFGGDTQALQTGAGCGATGALSPRYALEHQYAFGVRKSTKHTGVTFFDLDLDVDADSGLPSVSRDTAGLATLYEWDTMFRRTAARPQGALPDAWTKVVYSPLVPPVGYEIRRCAPGSVGCTGADQLTNEVTEFDGLGRIYRQKRRIPEGTPSRSRRVTLYDAMGNPWRVSEWVRDSATQPPTDELTLPATVFSEYDPFGRAGRVTPPDGSSHDVTRSYLGDRMVTTTSKVALAFAPAAETAVPRVERYDAQGRLFEVEEASIPGSSATVVTRYGYDEGDRLVRVCQDRTAPGGTEACGQERLFAYDNRGFLTSERHPEKGLAGNGSVGFGDYDARGHAGYRNDGSTARQVRFAWDAAERLTLVETGAGVDLKTFAYDGGAGGNGKLERASSFNVIGSPFSTTVEVRETYAYGGRQGRPSERTTEVFIGGSAGEIWLQAFDWTPLGQIASLDYPLCGEGGCLAGTPPTQAPIVHFQYQDGLLDEVPGVASHLAYHPNLTLASIDHVNAVQYVVDGDPNGMRRPAKLRVIQDLPDADPVTLADTGTYGYDGSGNVTAIGGERYRYDRAQRLVAGTYGPGWSQEVLFDRFGNLQSLTTNGLLRNTPTSATTNRLTGAASYDAGGNVLSWNGASYEYDLLNRLTRLDTGSETWVYAYTADDERIWAVKTDQSVSAWTLRDLGQQVLRSATFGGIGSLALALPGPAIAAGLAPETLIFADDFELGNYSRWSLHFPNGPSWTVLDYVRRGRELLASIDQDGDVRHFHLDHLGTPRLLTDDLGQPLAYHAYHPFGEEATSAATDDEVMKFTGHQRDLMTTTDLPQDDVDYLHARFRSPLTGRFLSVDPVLGQSRNPQSWNRYSYTYGNPLKYVDPTGRYVTGCTAGDEQCAKDAAAFEAARQDNLKSKDADVVAAAQAYGDAGVENGITVNFGDAGAGRSGWVQVYAQGRDDGSMGMVASVMIQSGLSRTNLRGAVAHEGSHLVDAQGFISSFTKNATSWDVSKNLTSFQTELNAYRLTHSIFKSANDRFGQSCTGCSLGQIRGLRTPADVDLAIKRILADPAGQYKVTPENPGPRQFSDWNDAP